MKKVGIVVGIAMAAAAMLMVGLGTQARAGAAGEGGISGKVYFHGKAPELRPLSMDKDPVCASSQSGEVLPEDGHVNSNGTLPNAFVYISGGSGNLSTPAPKNSVTLTQEGCIYKPHVLGIQVGQPLQVVTVDPTTHNIHLSATGGNRDWNVTQQPGTTSVNTKFTKPAIMVPVHCNIHPWMEAFIGVVTNPYFAVTGTDGSFTIKNVPAGDYTLSVWTATFGTQQHAVSVHTGETASLDFTFNK